MIAGDGWQTGGRRPTYEDLRKYCTLKTQLLIRVECYTNPLLCSVQRFSPNGEFVELGNGWMGVWVAPHEMEVLDIIEYPVPAEKKTEPHMGCSPASSEERRDLTDEVLKVHAEMLGEFFAAEPPSLWERFKNRLIRFLL